MNMGVQLPVGVLDFKLFGGYNPKVESLDCVVILFWSLRNATLQYLFPYEDTKASEIV